MNEDMISYYRDRAKEYEKIYEKPERQEDLHACTEILQHIFSGKEVFEMACGTGFWTEKISQSARSIMATDINESVIQIAKNKTYHSKISFGIVDIFTLDKTKKYESLFGGFIWSHIKLEELDRFIEIAHDLVQKGGTIVFMDNNYVEGSSIPLTEKDDHGNTYQVRELEDKTTHRIVKNFPSEKLIRDLLKDKAVETSLINLKYYWILKYSKP